VGQSPNSSGNRTLARLFVVPAACATCEESKTFAAGRDLTEWALCGFDDDQHNAQEWRMLCFFCLEEREPTEEHVFPEAIGGTLTIDRVCKACNDFLGAKVDVFLTNHELILIKRAEFGMIDSAGKAIDPMRKMFGVGKLANEPEKRIKLVPDPKTGRLQPRMMHHSIRTKRDDGTEAVQITLDESDIGEVGKILQRERKRAGLDPAPDHEIEAYVAAIRQQITSIEHPEVLYNLRIDTHDFQRGICKIIYELAGLWLGDAYLDDPVAEMFRNIILSGSEERIQGQISFGVVPSLSLWNGEPKAHVAMGSKQGEAFFVAVRIFDAASGVLCVTNTASKYPSLTEGRFLLIDLTGDFSRSSPLKEELIRMSKRHP
jgi:HNH endonuclease